METKLLYSDIKIGIKVMDEDGDIGTVKECDDPHNILVEFTNGGTALYCLVPNCEDGTNDLYAYYINLPEKCPNCYKDADYTDIIKKTANDLHEAFEYVSDAWFCNHCGGLVCWK